MPQIFVQQAFLNWVRLDGTKLPKIFCAKAPILKKDGSLQRDPENNAIFCTEQGVFSCYIMLTAPRKVEGNLPGEENNDSCVGRVQQGA